MPLPAALAAKLAKRGLISSNKLNEEQNKHQEEEQEEIFAENYDDTIITSYKSVDYNSEDNDEDEDDDDNVENVQNQINLKFKGHIGCPNKSNIYHECTKYCKNKWKDGKKYPNKIYINKKNKMLIKYPLPEHWKEVYDPGYGRYYYWDTQTDQVSWLPPDHPKAIITDCAAVLKEETHLAEGDKDSSSEDSDDEEEGDENDKEEENNKKKQQEEKRKHQEQLRSKGRTKKRENDLDPMDPASYSDIPRGGWSDGLQVETKTGVDTTVTGSLYQMRPYPSPGDILRANKKKKIDTEENSD